MGRSALRLAWYRLRATARRRAGGYAALTAVLGLIGGVTLAAVTAARRTESAYPDYLASTNPSAIIVQPNANPPAHATAAEAYRLYERLVSQISHLPHVTGVATSEAFNVATLTRRGGLGSVLFTQVQLVASPDGMFTRQDRVTITAGRPARAPDEVVATSRAAAQLHLHVGSRLQVGIYAPSPNELLPPPYRRLDLLVTGIGEASTQVVQDDIDVDRTGFLIGTPALYRQVAVCCEAASYLGLRVAGGGRYNAAVGQEYAFVHSPAIVQQAGLEALELGASALPAQRPAEIVNYRSMGAMPAILAGGLTAGAVAALGLTLVASVRRRRRDFALLKTLGFTRGQLAQAVAWQATVIAGAGLLIGIPLGIAAGRWVWLAFARQLSAVPLVAVPAVTITLCGLAGLVLVNLIAALPGRAAGRTPAAPVLRSE